VDQTKYSPAIIVQTAILLAATAAPARGEEIAKLLDKVRDFNVVQTVYRRGVPHTDRQGRRMMQYDSQRSFFQGGVWGNPFGEIYGVNYDLKVLTDAGFNTMWPWPSRSLADQLEAGKGAGLQVVCMGQVAEADAAKLKDHPNWLGNVWHDEPTGSFWGKDMDAKFSEFQTYKAKLNAAAPGVAVFINDVPWITAPATSWWVKWNTAGDVACHDNYPIMDRKARARSIGDEEHKTGIPSSVSLAAAVNNEQKPVWLIVGAFEVRGHGGFPFRMATPMQLRAQVYAGLIHGATGIIYFCWDTYVCRDGEVMGMSPDPKVAYLEAGPNKPKASPAKPMELAESKALWMAATQINREIRELTPSLLSPTVPDIVRYSAQVDGPAVTDNPIRGLLKPHPAGGYVLLTVNLDDAVLNVPWQFDNGLKSVEPLYENRPAYDLKAGEKSFTDLYEPFDVHVYRVATPAGT
jgi:hypothetical protein